MGSSSLIEILDGQQVERIYILDCITICRMDTLTIRTDETTQQALENLQEWTGQTRTQITRQALIDAERAARRAQLRAESAALASDPDDREEALAVLSEMEGIRAW